MKNRLSSFLFVAASITLPSLAMAQVSNPTQSKTLEQLASGLNNPQVSCVCVSPAIGTTVAQQVEATPVAVPSNLVAAAQVCKDKQRFVTYNNGNGSGALNPILCGLQVVSSEKVVRMRIPIHRTDAGFDQYNAIVFEQGGVPNDEEVFELNEQTKVTFYKDARYNYFAEMAGKAAATKTGGKAPIMDSDELGGTGPRIGLRYVPVAPHVAAGACQNPDNVNYHGVCESGAIANDDDVELHGSEGQDPSERSWH